MCRVLINTFSSNYHHKHTATRPKKVGWFSWDKKSGERLRADEEVLVSTIKSPYIYPELCKATALLHFELRYKKFYSATKLPWQNRNELLSPDAGSFRGFSLFSPCRASARLHLKKKKSLENFSAAGARSFYGTDFRHNDKGTAVNTVVFTRFLRKSGRKSVRQNR